jgi:predicted hotdog family 3-hydroxylacyl-ACP dehydratase
VALDRSWIAAHIPHAGNMCLLDEVLSWDSTRIECRSATHRAADNPLRAHGRLGSACGIEYAAQAMALHGALMVARSSATPTGYLAGVRAVVLHVERLDDIPQDLLISSERISGDATIAMYEFSVSAAARTLLNGRATIVLDAATLKRGERALPPPP